MYDQKDQLLKDLKNREIKAYEDIFFRYHGRLVLFANKFTGDISIAQDIVQDAFLKLWDKADSITINSSLKSYLFQAVRNSCLNYKRHFNISHSAIEVMTGRINNFEKSTYFDLNDPYYSLLELEIQNKVEEAINSMPEKCLEVYKLSRHKYLKNKEIAEKMGISVKMVEKHISKALSILRRELSDYLGLFLLLLMKNI